MSNPFFYGGRIENPKDFIGRKTELRAIFSALEHFKDGQAQHVSIVGERRIGKSSLLYHVTQIYKQYLSQPDRYRFVFIDLDNTHNHTLHGLLRFTLKQLGLPYTNRLTLGEFDEALEKLHDKNEICPILCLDEFEHLANRKSEFTNDVYEAFRSLGSNNKVSFLSASKLSLSDLIHQSSMTSTFPNIFIQIPLGEFSNIEAMELLQRSYPPFSKEETNRIFQIAGYHPAKLQITARILYNARESGVINWNNILKEYKHESQYLISRPDKNHSKPINWLMIIVLAIFVIFPREWIGRPILEIWMKDRNKVSDHTALLVGYGTIILTGLMLKGVFSIEQIKQVISEGIAVLKGQK